MFIREQWTRWSVKQVWKWGEHGWYKRVFHLGNTAALVLQGQAIDSVWFEEYILIEEPGLWGNEDRLYADNFEAI